MTQLHPDHPHLDQSHQDQVIAPAIVVDGDSVQIDHLRIADPSLARLMESEVIERRADLLRTIIETGVRGVLSMGVGVDLSELDQRVRHTVSMATTEAEAAVKALLEDAQRAMTSALDPDHRQSMMGRAFAEFTEWRDGFLAHVDPEQAAGHAGRLIERLAEMLGPGGALESRLSEALDPEGGDSALAQLASMIDRRFIEMRDLMAEERGRRDEAEHGTRKGFAYEDDLDGALRDACRPLGAIVERTSNASGLTSTDALVGDFTITLPGGQRIVVEAKHTKTISLTGTDGILSELDRAMMNRSAKVAICVSKNDAFPQEVGPFGVYGDRILVVDDGEGTLLRVALRSAQLLATASEHDEEGVDIPAISERLDRIRQLAQLFKTNRRALTNINSSVEQVRTSLDGMRADLLELLDDIDRALHTSPEGTIVPMARQAAG